MVNITFLGGTETVTGSKILVEHKDSTILIDCGLFQGLKELRLKNREKFPTTISKIDAIILTHAHLDHSGHLPVLGKLGFSKDIHCTFPTQSLTEIILRDSAKIQEEDTARANKHGYTKHKPALPLYSVKDAEKVLALLKPHNYDEWIIINPTFKFRLHNTGHILGSASVELLCNETKIIFSGDLGRQNPMILFPPKRLKNADYVILESTYGDRVHQENDPKELLLDVINETYKNGGTLIIPTFAVERAQEIIFLLTQLKIENRLPKIPIYLDSPMAVDATIVMLENMKWHKVSESMCAKMCNTVELVKDIASSKEIMNDPQQKIILAGSGMIEGGRVLHHLSKHLSDSKSTVLMVGFQAKGTRGRDLQEGVKQIKFFGKYYDVKCQIKEIPSLSAHADQNELTHWIEAINPAPKMVFLNHGEKKQSLALKDKIEKELSFPIELAVLNTKYLLD